MAENEKQKEGDDLMTCFVIHVSLLSLQIFLETAVLQKGLSFTTHLPTYVMGAQKNRFIETVLLSTLNICFG